MITKRQLIEQLEKDPSPDHTRVCLSIVEMSYDNAHSVDHNAQAEAQEVRIGNYRGAKVIYIEN